MQLRMLLSRLACAGGFVALAACSDSNTPRSRAGRQGGGGAIR
jgi:hypothetical protein